MMSPASSKHYAEDVLRSFLNEKLQIAKTIHPSYANLIEEIHRVTFAGGKRLRPHLVFIGYGHYDAAIATVAAAHELLHFSLLIHDDIIDRDDIRHDQATIHSSYNAGYYSKIASDIDRLHFSTSAALIAGDVLLSAAHELLATAPLSSQQHKVASSILSKGVFEVAGGQLLDTEAPYFQDTLDPLLIYRYKTAGYSFIAPLMTGVAFSPKNHSQTTLDHVRDFATNLGIAYQIRDDTLGTFGDTAHTGKSTISDLREGKQTLLIDIFKRKASQQDMSEFEQSFGKADASPKDLESLKQCIEQSGALHEVRAVELSYKQAALAAITKIDDNELRADLTAFVDYIDGRIK